MKWGGGGAATSDQICVVMWACLIELQTGKMAAKIKQEHAVHNWGHSVADGVRCSARTSSPTCENNGKSTENDGTNTTFVLTMALLTHTLRQHQQWHRLSARSTYDDLHALITRHVATSGRKSTSLKYHPQPQSQKKNRIVRIGVHRPPEDGTANFRGSTSCSNNASCCSERGVVLARKGG